MMENPPYQQQTFHHNEKNYRVVVLSGRVKDITLEASLGEGYEEPKISFIPLSGAVTMNVVITHQKG